MHEKPDITQRDLADKPPAGIAEKAALTGSILKRKTAEYEALQADASRLPDDVTAVSSPKWLLHFGLETAQPFLNAYPCP